MMVRKIILTSAVVAAIAAGGAGLAQAAPGDVTVGDDGIATLDLGTGHDPVVSGHTAR